MKYNIIPNTIMNNKNKNIYKNIMLLLLLLFSVFVLNTPVNASDVLNFSILFGKFC